MTAPGADGFATACSELVGQVAINPPLADAIVTALATGKLTPTSGPMGISSALKGFTGDYRIKGFLKSWQSQASHLSAADVTVTLETALACYRLAESRAHAVDAVWTGPDVARSEVRRTEAVVEEIIAGAQKELLVVGYWLAATTNQVRFLVEAVKEKAAQGVKVLFVLDPGEKTQGGDNFTALDEQWAPGLSAAPRGVYTWSDRLSKATTNSGLPYDRKLHAKVIVADRQDALVTSANLTRAGLQENLEMGLRM